MKKYLLIGIISTFALSACVNTAIRWMEREKRGIVGIVNDSLMLETTARYWSESDNGLNAGAHGYTNSGLYLLNYRKKQIVWVDTVDWYPDIAGQLSDSVVYGFGSGFENEVTFWKIGEKPIRKKIKNRVGDCAFPTRWLQEARIRHWKEGKFLLLPMDRVLGNAPDKCQYGILDTASGVITQGLFSGEYSWLAKCEDINFLDGNVVCLREPVDGGCGMDMLVDNELIDSLKLDSCKLYNLQERTPSFVFSGKYVIDDFFQKDGWKRSLSRVHKVLGYKFQLNYPETWLYRINYFYFYDSLGNSINYSEEDLNSIF